MIFNSLVFVIFFAIVFLIYWSLQNRLTIQNLILLVSSLVFYGWWDWRFLGLIILSSIIDFVVGKQIHGSNHDSIRKYWLLVSLTSNLGLLAFFKYYNFFTDSFVDMVGVFGWNPGYVTLNIILPVGISFYTFQTLSYTIDIYRRQFEPTNNFTNFLTYIAFFPQLVAGPIERAADLLPQIETRRKFNREWFNAGLIQTGVGFIRKIVIADNLAKYVDPVFENPEFHNSTTLVIATIFYAFQIYFDFSGYSDIAIGIAKMLGFKFNRNFNLPYFSKSITEFWRRWHISLSTWLRDYLYISLGGNRKGIKIQYRNLMITMLVGGLWHGSSWNFIIWGGIHGMVLVMEKFIFSRNFFSVFRRRPFNYLGILITFFIVCISWIFFRAPTLEDAFFILKKIFSFDFGRPFMNDINILATVLFALFLGFIVDTYLYKKKIPLEVWGAKFSPIQIGLFLTATILIISLFFSNSNNFIYFQF